MPMNPDDTLPMAALVIELGEDLATDEGIVVLGEPLWPLDPWPVDE